MTMRSQCRILLWVLLTGIFYLLFAQQYTASVDDVQYVALAKSHGIGSVLYKNADSYYPVCRIAALLGFSGLQVAAVASVALFGWYAFRVGGYVFSAVVTCGIIYLLGDMRSPFASSVGMATHVHFLFLLAAILMTSFPRILKKSDAYTVCILSFISGLPGIVAPLFLIGRPTRLRIFMFTGASVGLIAHVALKQVLPSDMTLVAAQDQSMLTRAISFDFWLWLSVMGVQGITSMFPGREIGAVVAQVSYDHPDILVAFGALSSGWLLVTLYGGWRYFTAVTWASICCFSLSIPTIKAHMLPYPNHGHYLHWIAGAVFIALCLRLFNKVQS